jgi:hypothetical protein
MGQSDDRTPNEHLLASALARCAGKLKVEYDRQQPDAGPDECWAEAEAAWDLLKEWHELPSRGQSE